MTKGKIWMRNPTALWMISYTWGNSRWAKSDDYSEHEVTYLTDLHPVEYIARVQEFWREGKCFGFKTIMEIPAGTITEDQLKLWDTGKWTMGLHTRAKLLAKQSEEAARRAGWRWDGNRFRNHNTNDTYVPDGEGEDWIALCSYHQIALLPQR